jgi:DNA polymerase elongation subunit (family B)
VLGLANLSQDEIKWIQEEIKKHCEQFDTDYKFVYRYHASEFSLLNDLFFNFIDKLECVTGWNWFGYDWPYLYNRAPKLGLDITSLSPTKTWFTYKPQDVAADNIKLPMHKCMYDYMELYKKHDRSISPKVSNKLDWVADKVLGVKKVVHQLGFKEMWEKQKKEYVFYNAIDSVLIREIDKKLKTSSVMFGLASLMNVPVLSTYSSTKSIEIVQAEYLYRENRVFPVVKKDKEKKEYEGAFVFSPIPGMYRNVYCLDYASLYPTTMRQFNISPDTLLFKDKNHIPKENEIKCTNGCVYTNEFEGFIPKILSDYFAKRKEYKKMMVKAQKEKYHLIDILKEREKKLKNNLQ